MGVKKFHTYLENVMNLMMIFLNKTKVQKAKSNKNLGVKTIPEYNHRCRISYLMGCGYQDIELCYQEIPPEISRCHALFVNELVKLQFVHVFD